MRRIAIIMATAFTMVLLAIMCGCGSTANQEPDKIVGEYPLYDQRNFQSGEMVRLSDTRYLLTVNQDGTFSAVNRADSSDVLVEGTWEKTDNEKIYKAVVPKYTQLEASPKLDSDSWTMVFQTALTKESNGSMTSREYLVLHNGNIDVYRFNITGN